MVFTAAAVLLPFDARADVVSQERARTVAQNFFGLPQTKSGDGLTFVWDGEEAVTKSSAKPAFYIFNRDAGGFVIVSGEDAANPILGYSYSKLFPAAGELPDNLAFWLNEQKGEINALRAVQAKPSERVKGEWAEALAMTKGGNTIVPVIWHNTAEYGQGVPFNNQTPTIGGKKTLTGCVATALCEIFEYWRWPVKGSGTLPKNTATNSSSYDADFGPFTLGHEYDWDNFLHSYKSGYTAAQAQAVSTLMRDIGAAGNLNYGTSGTGGSTATIVARAITYFGYSKQAYRVSRLYFSDEEWAEALKKSLRENGPIIYSATQDDGSGSHSFICDGYDANDFFHFNWGWSGSGNGFYRNSVEYINQPNPSSSLYTKSHTCWLYLHPGMGNEPTGASLYLGSGSYSGTSYKGLELVGSSSVTKGVSFKVKAGIINSGNPVKSTFEVTVGHFDKNGQLLEYVCSPVEITLSGAAFTGNNTGISSINCLMDKDVSLGDYLQLCYRLAGDGDDAWAPMPYHNFSSSVTGRLEIAATTLASRTTMAYDKATGKYKFTTDRNIPFALYNSKGEQVTNGIEGRYGQIVVDTTKLEADTYTLSITSKTVVDDTVELKIIVK